jgi:hypothetical protein
MRHPMKQSILPSARLICCATDETVYEALRLRGARRVKNEQKMRKLSAAFSPQPWCDGSPDAHVQAGCTTCRAAMAQSKKY